jgi:hypothetical protein
MVSAVAFACVRPEGIAMRGIEFTPEVKASLDVLGVGALGQKALNDGPIEKREPRGNRVEQHLNLIHTATASVEFPPLTVERDLTFAGIVDIPADTDCFGVCFYELIQSREYILAIDNGYKSDPAARAFRRLTDVPNEAILKDEIAYRYRRAMCSNATFSFVEEPNYLLSDGRSFSPNSVLKVVSKYKVWSVLLIETPAHGGECSMRVYANPIGGSKV